MSEFSASRRAFVKGAALGAAALGVTAVASAAVAEEAVGDGSYTYADTIAWDAEYDVVVLGIGFAGMAAATDAADAGASVLICEKAPDGEAGGNSRVCGQMFAYGHDDVDACVQYYMAIAAGRAVPEDMIGIISEGVAGMATMLSEKYGLDREKFADCTEVFNGSMSPEYPEFPGSDQIRLWSTNGSYGDSALYQAMRSRIAGSYADKIDVWFETPGVELVQDPVSKAVIGVVVDRKGETRNVRALNGVCVCTGGFECEPEMVQHHLGIIPGYCVGGGQFNEGDGVKMCQKVGARLWHMNAYEGVGCTYHYDPETFSYTRLPAVATTGSSMIVGSWGRRFMNETESARHGHLSLGNGIWENPEWPEKIFCVFDQAKMDEIEEAGGFEEAYVGDVASCASVSEAAEVIGCDEANLQQTLDDFNAYVEGGRDYDCGRDVATMRALDGVAYYVVRLRPGILNTQGGPERNANAEVLDIDGDPIPHLYSAGEMGGITSCMYQGGTNVAECFIFGQIAGTNAAAVKDALPAYEAAPKVESTPAHLGDETDLGANSPTIEAGEGELVGVGKGMGGDVPVTVTLADDGTIAEVVVGENSETDGIGSKAIEQLPGQFAGLSTAEEIDALDAVSGATVTSNALKDAVKAALGL